MGCFCAPLHSITAILQCKQTPHEAATACDTWRQLLCQKHIPGSSVESAKGCHCCTQYYRMHSSLNEQKPDIDENLFASTGTGRSMFHQRKGSPLVLQSHALELTALAGTWGSTALHACPWPPASLGTLCWRGIHIPVLLFLSQGCGGTLLLRVSACR